jgi:hypothetical protein
MANKKETFNITSLSRDDIATLGYKNAESISDEMMEKIAEKMANSYIENQFWIDLKYMVDYYCNLERKKKAS